MISRAVAAILLAIAVALAGMLAFTMHSRSQLRAELAKDQQDHAKQLRDQSDQFARDVAARAAESERRDIAREENIRALQTDLANAASQLDDARADQRRLQLAARAAAAAAKIGPASPDSAVAIRGPADRLADVAEDCAGAYLEVAAAADRAIRRGLGTERAYDSLTAAQQAEE